MAYEVVVDKEDMYRIRDGKTGELFLGSYKTQEAVDWALERLEKRRPAELHDTVDLQKLLMSSNEKRRLGIYNVNPDHPAYAPKYKKGLDAHQYR